MTFDPQRLAVSYYFGDLQYWKLPSIAVQALEQGFDGPFLRRLAALNNPVESDMRQAEVDAAFREMGVNAPIDKNAARLILAEEWAANAMRGEWSVFDAATHIRIDICELKSPPPELSRIITLSKQARHAPSCEWEQLEAELRDAISQFLKSREHC